MPALRNAGKNLARLREIAAVVVRHGFGDLFDRARFFETLGFRPKEEANGARQRLSGAARFRLMLTELGPTFVKLGQVLSSRPDILPPDYVRELATLQDRVAPIPPELVRQGIERGLGRPVDELFPWLDPTPLASASIAQVHAARTADGREVVVKVQRPGITGSVRADLDLLYYLAQFLERVVEETGVYSPVGVVEEFEKHLMLEFDFLNEAANCRLFHEKNEGRPYIVIPAVHDDLTCSTVLTLERITGGVKITELGPEHDPKQVARNLAEAAFDHLFVDSVFHGDPHPGNLLVLPDNRVVMLDFGVIGRVSRSMQETIVVLCLAVALQDPETIARVVYRIGMPDQRVNLGAFRQEIAGILDRLKGLELRQIRTVSLINELLDLAMRYRIKVPKDYALLIRSGVAIEGVVRQLHPEMNVLEVAEPYARRLLFERLAPTSASGMGLRALLQLQSFMTDVPLQLSQLLLDLEGGKFAVHVRSADLPNVVSALRGLGIVVFSGLIAAALIVGSFVMLAARPTWEYHGIPVLAALGFVVAGLFMGSATMWVLLGGRIHKISVRRFFGKGP